MLERVAFGFQPIGMTGHGFVFVAPKLFFIGRSGDKPINVYIDGKQLPQKAQP